ncbi:MAG TPA: gamma-glutamyltransferase [Gaiellaceae bacterium]|nr:gamma-glutamyltransferase [Gaiellaceae bacterium]
MRGAVAAGHPLTQAAGSRILEAGGSAVDACVAAALVSWVVESPLTGPGGGGFLLVHAEGRTVVLDCFVALPARGAGGREQLLALAVDFDGDTQQVFRTGPAAVAVPGSALGLAEAHARWGRLPWASLFEDAVAVARGGFVLSEAQGYLHEILAPLLRHSPEGDAMYGSARAGDRLAFPELAATLEVLAVDGVDELYRGSLARAICAHVPLTPEDLASYAVVEREPLSVRFRGHEVRTNPPPSSGGRLLAVGLGALAGGASVVEAMRAMEAERSAAVGGTTHISVVDGDGCVAALSASLGSGSGVVVPGTGIHLNNMLGEADLAGVDAGPGERLTSMMAPTLVLRGGSPRLVVGSAGSNRLRGAILQVVENVVGRGLPVREAVDAPRVHWEAGQTHCEPGAAGCEGEDVVRWRGRNLFFGGVAAVELRDDGSLAAAGDPRRGGAP